MLHSKLKPFILMSISKGDIKMRQHIIEVIKLDGVSWNLWNDNISDKDFGNELYRALKIYPKVRVNKKEIYTREA